MTQSISKTSAVSLIAEAADRLGWQTEVLDEYGYLFELRRPDGAHRVLLGGRSALNDAVAARLAGDKHYAAVLMRRAGLRVPRVVRCIAPRHPAMQGSPERAGIGPGLELAEQLGFPLVVKPNALSHGRGVTLVDDVASLQEAVHACWELDTIALAQELVDGRDLRLDFLDGEYLLGYERLPIVVTGDGERPLGALFEALDARFDRPEALLKTARIAALLEARALTWDSVLVAGEVLDLGGPIRNLNAGCTARFVPAIPDALRDHCLRAAAAVGLRHFGVDLKLASLDADPTTAVFIEINASPLLTQIARIGHREEALAAQERVLRRTLPGPDR